MDYNDFYAWVNKRENLNPQQSDFYVYEDAYTKTFHLLNGLQSYIDDFLWRDLNYNLALHFIISNPYEYEGVINPLYNKYDIKEKSSGIISSASDESSSASYHITDALQQLDMFAMDLINTPYGKWVYGILTQLNIKTVLL